MNTDFSRLLDSVFRMEYIWFYQVRDKRLPGRSFRNRHQADRPEASVKATRAEDCRVEIRRANACGGNPRRIQPGRSKNWSVIERLDC